MEPIFAQLSLEYLLAGKKLPWNKQRQEFRDNLLTPSPRWQKSERRLNDWDELLSGPRYFSL